MRTLLNKTWIFTAALMLALPLPLAAKGAHSSELGGIKMLACHGPTCHRPGEACSDGGFTEQEILEGAYSAWCYGKDGNKTAVIHHGAPLDAYNGNGEFVVTFIHYDDRNKNGVLEENEIDGTIAMLARTGEISFDRAVPSRSGSSFVVAVEGDNFLHADGWFKGTRQGISRTNLVAIPTLDEDFNIVALDVQYLNFSVLSFLQEPVQIVE